MLRISMKPRTLSLKGTVSAFRDIKSLGQINFVWKNNKGIAGLFRDLSNDTKKIGLKYKPSYAGAPAYGANQIRIDTHSQNSIHQVEYACNSVFTQNGETSFSVKSYRIALKSNFERTGLKIGFSSAGISISRWILSHSHGAKPGTLIKQYIKMRDPLSAMKITANLSESNLSFHFLLRENIGEEYHDSLSGFPIFMGGITPGWRFNLENENHKLRVPVNEKRLSI